MVCIVRYGHGTWYTIILALSSVGLSTATISYLLFIWTQYINGVNWLQNSNDDGEPFGDTSVLSCGVSGNQLLQSWCGTKSPPFIFINNYDKTRGYEWNGYHWLIWANCVLWAGYCVVKQAKKPSAMPRFLRLPFIWLVARFAIQSTNQKGSGMRKTSPFRLSHGLARSLNHRKAKRGWRSGFLIDEILHWVELLLFTSTWSICFVFHFYFFSFFASSREISNEWTFGQIIAVAVWLPSLVEYIYLLISKSRRSTVLINLCSLGGDGIEAGSQYRLNLPLMVVAQPPQPVIMPTHESSEQVSFETATPGESSSMEDLESPGSLTD